MIVFSAMCRAGTIDPSSSDEKHLEYAEGFSCVVLIEGKCNCGKDHDFHGSAVVIAPRWVLTAAHVVQDIEKLWVSAEGRKIEIDKKFVNESFDKKKMGVADIALCRLSEDLVLDFYPELYAESDEVGKTVSMGGYGATGTFSTGFTKSDKRKRAGSNIVARAEKDVIFCHLSDRKTSMEMIIAPGDSGGGLFIGNKLAGINSFVSASDGNTNSGYGDEGAHTRVSKFVPWVREKMGNDGN